jgi:hypothetical protein
MLDQTRLLYLIGLFPAINHSYLLAEVRHLRACGSDGAQNGPTGAFHLFVSARQESKHRRVVLGSASGSDAVSVSLSEYQRHRRSRLQLLTQSAKGSPHY